MPSFKVLIPVLISILLSGCATTDYVTHYGIFTAENSDGELRQFRIHWQTLRYEGWTENQFRGLPVVLETQCSRREIYLYDESFGSSRRCENSGGPGIHYCGRTALDMDRHGLEIENNTVCLSVTDKRGSTDILSLQGEVLVTVSCRPKSTQKQIKGKKHSIDYLLNSEIPYVVSTKSIKGADIDLLIPALSTHSSICDPDS